MRNLILLTLIICVEQHLIGQNVVRVNQVPELNPSSARLWDKAIIQHGIIGSDFWGPQKIGNAAAERFANPASPAPDFWFPIDTIKRTFGGELEKIYIYNPTIPGINLHVGDDFDHNLNIIPTIDYTSDFRYSLQKAVERMDGDDPYVDASIETESACNKSDFESYRVKFMQLEIDLHKSNAREYFNSGKQTAPKVKSGVTKGDIVFGYGAWISDAGHCFKPEIHPAEQIWWRGSISKTETSHYLLLTCDQSDRFDERADFDEDEISGRDRHLAQVWAPRPLDGTFALQFSLDPKQEVIDINLIRIGGQAVTSLYNDGKINYLVYKGDTVAIVREPINADVLKISFEKMHKGFDKKTLYGYVTIQAKVGQAQQGAFDKSEGGYLFLKADMKKKLRRQIVNTGVSN